MARAQIMLWLLRNPGEGERSIQGRFQEGAMRLLLALLLLLATSATAQERGAFRDWNTGRTTNGSALYAATANDSGNVLGQYCYGEEQCIYLLGMRTSCKEGNRYP